MKRRGAPVVALLACVIPVPAANAQQILRGVVLATESRTPLAGASVRALQSRTAATTDRFGRFTLVLAQTPDSIVAAFIGRSPDTSLAQGMSPLFLAVSLRQASLTLGDVTVAARIPSAEVGLRSLARWELPAAAMRATPAAIEADVFRGLSLVPAVSFSTPLSARPTIRGYDSGESSFTIDGFEVLNLYHLGRAFSAFPAEAADQVTVAAAPSDATTGGTVAGLVDVTGKTGSADGSRGGASLSLASLTGWIGGGEGVRWFGAARGVHLGLLDALSSTIVPYDFQDFYGSAALTSHGVTRARLTVFASRDHLLDRDAGSGMDWNNLLVGGRWRVLERGRATITVSAAGSRFGEDVTNVEARDTRLDVRNRFSRVSGGAELALHGAHSRLLLGGSWASRVIENRIQPIAETREFPSTDTRRRRAEASAYVEWSRTLGNAGVALGMRLDAAGGTHVWQPRARAHVAVSDRLWAGAAVGRATRLFHLVSDPRTEPDLAFYDFWLNAGENGVPVPTADHASIDLSYGHGAVAARLSLYASTSKGLVELRPVTDQRVDEASPFRDGSGRTRGLEAQLSLRGGAPNAPSLAVTYVLSKSDRRWDDRWVPWALDRRHTVRVSAQGRLTRRISVFGAGEAMSGAPVTPVDQVVLVDLGSDERRPAYLYGPENSARSSGTMRFDFGGEFHFTGPWRSRMAVGVSVINATFGAVAPLVPRDPAHLLGLVGDSPLATRVTYERLFSMPAVPSLTVRAEL